VAIETTVTDALDCGEGQADGAASTGGFMDAVRNTISPAYLLEQRRLHQDPDYGIASLAFAPLVAQLLKLGGYSSVSDYGAGKCNLKSALGLYRSGRADYFPYDPAFPEYGLPRAADLLVCIDVLEHVEPDAIGNVLDEVAPLAWRMALLTVHTGPAKKILSDGRNAHLIQQPPSWWLPRLARRFELIHVQSVPKGFFVIAAPLGNYGAVSAIQVLGIAKYAARMRSRSHRTLKARLRRLFARF